MAARSPLRRWKPFFGAFASVDAAIEAADPDLCRDEFRRARGDIVRLICDAADDDKAERLSRVIDDVMSEALETLRLVPTMAKVLASTDLSEAVGALLNHDSERVRLLASDIMSGWKASVQDELAKAQAVLEKLDKMPQPKEMEQQASSDLDETMILEPSAKKTATVVGSDRVRTAKIAEPPLGRNRVPVAAGSGRVKPSNTDASTKSPLSKKSPPAVSILCGDRAVRPISDDDKMATTKRKLREYYQEAEDAKRQRKIQVVQAPEMMKQRQRKMHPIMRERSRVHCASSMVKRSISVSRLRTILGYSYEC